MIKRIGLLILAAMLVATMAMAGLAGPALAKCPQSANCVVTGPGNSENTSAAQGGNPNIREEFQPGSRGNR